MKKVSSSIFFLFFFPFFPSLALPPLTTSQILHNTCKRLALEEPSDIGQTSSQFSANKVQFRKGHETNSFDVDKASADANITKRHFSASILTKAKLRNYGSQ